MTERASSRLEAELRFHAKLLKELDAAVVAWDADGLVTHLSDGAQRMTGWTREAIIGRPLPRLGDAPLPAAGFREAWTGEHVIPAADGTQIPVSVRVSPLHAPDGTPEGCIAVAFDLSERRRAAALLERRVEQQAGVAELGERALEGMDTAGLKRLAVELAAANTEMAGAVFLDHDVDAGLLRASAAAGLAEDEMDVWSMSARANRPSAIVLRTGEAMVIHDWSADNGYDAPPVVGLNPTHGSSIAVAVKGRDATEGVLVAFGVHANAFTNDDLHFLQSMANVLSDAIDRERSEAAVRYQALHDRITGLPNRALFLDRLAHALALGRRRRRDLAVLFLDLDHFKLINDTLGHAAGDDLLQQVAPRLRGAVRPADTVARFGGDEFVLLCEDVDELYAATIARRILQAFADPFVLAGQDHFLTTSVGIALTGRPGTTAEALVRDADAAMYRAKDRGRGRYEIFDEDMRARALARLRLEAELRRALDRDELRLHYQPVVRAEDDAIIGLEALVRWQHPKRGLLAAGEFVPLAEETGLIVPITRWVLDTALAQVACWRAEHPVVENINVGINVSSADITRPDFGEVVLAALTRHRVPPEALSLEVREATLVDPSPVTVETFRWLRELGCWITLDDFGSGYSSLSHLETFPARILKIDRSFVARLQDGVDNAPVARAIVGLGQALDLIVVAEGVETAEQETSLLALGCRFLQGFRYARPMPADECGALLGRPLRVGEKSVMLTATNGIRRDGNPRGHAGHGDPAQDAEGVAAPSAGIGAPGATSADGRGPRP